VRVLHERVRIRGGIGQHLPHEPIAEHLLIGREALRAAEAVALEAIGEHGQILALHARLHLRELVGRDVHAGRVGHRERRLRENRGEHRGLEHHREGEVAGEAHADRTDALPATERVGVRRERAQPVDDRARLVRREGAKLTAHAGLGDHPEPVENGRRPARIAEQVRHPDREAGVADETRKARHLGRDAGHLGHHDHRRALARDEHELGLAEEAHLPPLEVLERVPLLRVVLAHGGSVRIA